MSVERRPGYELSVTVRLGCDGDPGGVYGEVMTDDAQWEFAGWLALMSRLELLVSRAAPHADPPAA